MEIEMFSRIELKDGTVGNIVEIWEDEEEYEFEPADHSDFDDGAPLTYLIHRGDIAKVIA